MQSMDTELLRLCRQGAITAEEAYMKANIKSDFEELLEEEKKGFGADMEPGARAAASLENNEPTPDGEPGAAN